MKNKKRKKNRFLTDSEIIEIGKKYETITQFRKSDESACRTAYLRGLISLIFGDDGYSYDLTELNFELVKKEALKYDTRTKFQREAQRHYKWATKNNVLDDVCSHMKLQGSRFFRLIYAIENKYENRAYIGLTYDFEKRKNEHINNSSNHYIRDADKNDLEFKILTDLLPVRDSKEQEQYWVEKYKSNGFEVTNIRKTGGIGSQIILYTIDVLKELALQYKTRKELRKNNKAAYNRALKLKVLDEIFSFCRNKGLERITSLAIAG